MPHTSLFRRFGRFLNAPARPARRATYQPSVEAFDERVLPSCTINWRPAGAGFWDVPGNWDRGEVPNSDDDVCIPAGTGAVTFRGNPAQPPQARSVESSREFIITAGTFGVTDGFALLNNSFLTLRAGTLSNTTLTQGVIRSTVRFGGTLDGVTVESGASIALTGLAEESLSVTGGLTLNGTATLGRDTGGYFGALLFRGTQTLGGAGQVVFATTWNSSTQYSAIVPESGSLTIGPDILVSGARGWVGPGNSWGGTGTLVLQGAIQADRNGASNIITVGAPGWQSQGQLRAFPGSTLHLVSRLDNVGRTLSLVGNALGAAGTFRLVNGTIFQGIVATTLGAALGGATQGQGTAILDGVTVNGNLALATAQEETLTVENGLTLNGTATLGRDSGGYFGALLFRGTQTLGGAGQVVFATTWNSSTQYSAIVPESGSLTIGPDIFVRGARGWVGPGNRWAGTGTFVLQGTIQADRNGSNNIIFVGALNWQSEGQLRAYPGSSLHLVNRLDNEGRTLSLTGNALGAAGTIRLVNGTIFQGIVATTLGAALGGATQGQGTAVLDGVTVNGNLALSTATPEEALVIQNGLTLNGAATLGRADGGYYGALLFRGTQTLGGSGHVVFATNWAQSNFYSAVVPESGTLTVGPNVTIRGARGWVGPGNRWAGAGTFVLQGTIQAEVNAQTITVAGTNWTNNGTFRAINGATLAVSGTCTNYGNNTLTGGTWAAANGTLLLPGWDILTNQAALYLEGANGRINKSSTASALTARRTNGEHGRLEVRGDQNLPLSSPLVQNDGIFWVGNRGTLNLQAGAYTQGPNDQALLGVEETARFEAGGLVNIVNGMVFQLGGTIQAPAGMRVSQAAYYLGWGVVEGNLENRGSLFVGSYRGAGPLDVTGNFLQTATGLLHLELGNPDFYNYDLLYVRGTGVVRGLVYVELLPDFVAREGDFYYCVCALGGLTFEADLAYPDLGPVFEFVPYLDGYCLGFLVQRR